MPGLVNAHTHLELSWMAGLVPPQPDMDTWIGELMRVRAAGPASGPDTIAEAAQAAASAMVACGTVLVGDISNTLSTPAVLDAAGLGGVVFHELIGFASTSPADADARVRDAWARVAAAAKTAETRSGLVSEKRVPIAFSVVAHAPYSVAPELIRAIGRAARTAPLAIHLGESDAEMALIATGEGPMRRLLERLGVWDGLWPVPACDPVAYVDRLGYLRPGTLVVHAARLGAPALEALRRANAVIVSCPRSNRWVGSGAPPLAAFYRAGIPVAFGTDSLASAPSLNLFEELAEARRIAPDVPAAALLASATRVGADALGLGADYGTIEPGKRAALVAVSVPAGVADVEEYLVGGDVRAPQDVRLIRSR